MVHLTIFLDPLIPVVGAWVLVDRKLREDRWAQECALVDKGESYDDGHGRQCSTDTIAGRERPREGTKANDVVGIDQLNDRDWIPVETEQTVGIVFDHEGVMVSTDFGDTRVALDQKTYPIRAVETGNRIEKLNRSALGLKPVNDAYEPSGNEALGVHGNMHDVRLVGMGSSEGLDIRKGFRRDDVVRVNENLRDEVKSLLRADGDDGVVRMAANAVGARDLDNYFT